MLVNKCPLCTVCAVGLVVIFVYFLCYHGIGAALVSAAGMLMAYAIGIHRVMNVMGVDINAKKVELERQWAQMSPFGARKLG